MRRLLIFIAVAALAAIFFGKPVIAQTNYCDLQEHITAELKGAFQETTIVRGLGKDNAMLEVFVSNSGSWTLVRTQVHPSGTKWSCIIYAGQAWQAVSQSKGTAL